MTSVEVVGLSKHLQQALGAPLPDEAREHAARHTLDTLAAAVSGSRLLPGTIGISYVRGRAHEGAGTTVVGTDVRVTADWSALVNGMAAHADETDDSHEGSWSHPGCAVVPAALASAELHDRTIGELLRGVAAGYDVGVRVMLAIGREHIGWWEPHVRNVMRSMWSTHAYTGVFGATAASAVLFGLDDRKVRFALSYAVQQASGFTTYIRDVNHIEKAYVFGGMPAHNGVAAALMVAAGFDGVEDPFTGTPGFLAALSPDPQPEALVDGLGERYEVTRTNIKKFAVGSPAQAPVQALLDLTGGRAVAAEDVEQIVVRLPSDYAAVVDGRDMPDVNVQYLVAASLLDGHCTFAAAHDMERFADPEVRKVMDRVQLLADDAMETKRQAIVELRLRGEEPQQRHVEQVRGTVADPMSRDEVVAKARDLMEPVLGGERTTAVVDLLFGDDEGRVRALCEALALG